MHDLENATDEDLMIAVRGGDGEAFSALYGRHKNGVIHFCTQMLHNAEDAADVFQETFRYLHRHAATYVPSAKFTTYLFRIARNLCIDILRRKKRWNLQPLDPEVDPSDDRDAPKTRLEVEEVEANIKDALRDVPEPYREVLLLRLTQQLPYEDIARMVDAPVGTVKSRLHSGFEILRRALRRRNVTG